MAFKTILKDNRRHLCDTSYAYPGEAGNIVTGEIDVYTSLVVKFDKKEGVLKFDMDVFDAHEFFDTIGEGAITTHYQHMISWEYKGRTHWDTWEYVMRLVKDMRVTARQQIQGRYDFTQPETQEEGA